MHKKATKTMAKSDRGLTVGIAIVLWVFGGCASETPKAPPPITQDQVRDHSEKAFEKLKQEEKSRVSGSPADSY